MKILVLGGAGYIGSVLTPRLVADGHEVTVIDNFIYGQNSLSQLCAFDNFHVVKADVRDWDAIKAYVQVADVIIPLAGLVGAPLCDRNPIDAKLVNLDHPLRLFKSKSKDQRIIMPTTESAYGSNQEVCTEETPINPLSTYAKDKATVEAALLYHENAVSLRFATVFGMSPRMRLDLLINDFVWRAVKDGAIVLFESGFKRTCLHVRDAAHAILCAVDDMPDGVYNVGSFSASKMDICEAIKRQCPNFVYVEADSGKDPDQRNYVVSSAKLLKTGFQFVFNLNNGITELRKGYEMLSNSRYGNV